MSAAHPDVLGTSVAPARPVWRGRMHTWAFVASIPAGAALIALAPHPMARLSAAIYATTLILLFGTSAAYHRLARGARSRRVMQRLDHAMIYLLIAGSYTPLCLVALPREWGVPVLAVVTATAIIGIALKLVAFERAGRIAYALYPMMGWAAIIALPALVEHLSPRQLILVAASGITYTVGAIILASRRPDPLPAIFGYHEVWHALTVVAAALHFIAITDLVA